MISKIKKSYEDLSTTKKAAVWFAFCSFFQQGVAVLTIPIFTRLLSTSDFGIVAVYNSWLAIISIFCTLNLSSGVFNNGMIKYEHSRDEYVSAMQGLSMLTTALVFLLYLAFQDFWDSVIALPPALVMLMFIQIATTPSLNYWMVRQRFEFKYQKLIIITVLVGLVTPLLGVLLILISDNDVLGRVSSMVIVQFVVGLVFLVYHFRNDRTIYNKDMWVFAIKFNLPLLPHYLALIVLSQINRIVINLYCTPSEVGIYSIAFSAANLLSILAAAINATLVPWAYRKFKENHYSDLSKIALGLTILMSIAMLILVLVAPEVVWILAPEDYFAAVYLIPIISIGFLFAFVTSLTGTIEFYFESTVTIAISSVACAFLNILLAIFLVPLFGYVAAALVMMVSYIFWAFARILSMNRVIEKAQIIEKPFSVIRVLLIVSLFSLLSIGVLALYSCHCIFRYLLLAATLLIGVCIYKKFGNFSNLRR